MTGAVAAIVIRKEKDIVAAFEARGATSAATAKPLGALNLEESRFFERLVRRGVLHKGDPGTWYLDQAGWQAERAKRRRLALMLMAVMLFALALGLGLLPSGPR